MLVAVPCFSPKSRRQNIRYLMAYCNSSRKENRNHKYVQRLHSERNSGKAQVW